MAGNIFISDDFSTSTCRLCSWPDIGPYAIDESSTVEIEQGIFFDVISLQWEEESQSIIGIA